MYSGYLSACLSACCFISLHSHWPMLVYSAWQYRRISLGYHCQYGKFTGGGTVIFLCRYGGCRFVGLADQGLSMQGLLPWMDLKLCIQCPWSFCYLSACVLLITCHGLTLSSHVFALRVITCHGLTPSSHVFALRVITCHGLTPSSHVFTLRVITFHSLTPSSHVFALSVITCHGLTPSSHYLHCV
jgi:hypothetical protein